MKKFGLSKGLFLESPENFSGPKNHWSNCNTLALKSWSFKCFERNTKRIAKFDGLEPKRCEDLKRIVVLEIVSGLLSSLSSAEWTRYILRT